MLIGYCPLDRGRTSFNLTLWEPTRKTHTVCFLCAVICFVILPWWSCMLTTEKDVDMNSLCWSQFRLSPERGALHARLNVYLILSPGFGHQVGLSLLQTPPLCCLLLFGELSLHLLPDNLLWHTHQQRHQITTGAA